MAKRKAASIVSTRPTKAAREEEAEDKTPATGVPEATAPSANSSPAITDKLFRFLDLPPELRTKIFEIAAANFGTGLLGRRSRGVVASADAISKVNKQIHEEYLGVLYGHAATVLVHVLDFDFRHIVTFYNKLSVSEIKALPKKSEKPSTTKPKKLPLKPYGKYSAALMAKPKPKAPPQHSPPARKPRTVKILLDVTSYCSWQHDLLLRWINRLDSQGKISVETAIVYEAYDVHTIADWDSRIDFGAPNLFKMDRFAGWTDGQREEVAKMQGVAREAVRRVREIKESRVLLHF